MSGYWTHLFERLCHQLDVVVEEHPPPDGLLYQTQHLLHTHHARFDDKGAKIIGHSESWQHVCW